MNILSLAVVVVIVSICLQFIPGNTYTVPNFGKKYLTPGQWGSIRRILSNPKTSCGIIQKTRKIIYTYYENWAIQRAHSFRKNHPGLCRHISVDELSVYSSKGLIRAIEGCDYAGLGNTPFSVYASKWIDYELLDGMTDLQPMTILPKRIRKRKGVYNRKQYRIGSDSIENREYSRKKRDMDTNTNAKIDETYEYEDAWKTVDNTFTTPFSNRVFRWKYSPTFDQVRSNAEVAVLMCCSEETIRKCINKYSLDN